MGAMNVKLGNIHPVVCSVLCFNYRLLCFLLASSFHSSPGICCTVVKLGLTNFYHHQA